MVVHIPLTLWTNYHQIWSQDGEPFTNGKVVAFITVVSPFTNCHQCNANDEDGVVWPNSLAYYQGLKVKHLNDDETYVRLTETKSAAQCFRLGLNVKDVKSADWYQNAKTNAMVQVSHTKFTQNHHLRSFVLSFAGTHFVEGTPCPNMWGIGSVLGAKHQFSKLVQTCIVIYNTAIYLLNSI